MEQLEHDGVAASAKKRKGGRLALLAAALLLVCAAAFFFTHAFINGQLVSLRCEDYAVESGERVDVDALSRLTRLTRLDLRAADITPAQLETLSAALPACDILWNVPLGGARFDALSEALTLPANAVEGDLALLSYFPRLRSVDASACDCYEAVVALSKERPELAFVWGVPVGGTRVRSDVAVLTVDSATDASDILDALPLLPLVTQIELTGKPAPLSTVDALRKARPELTLSYTISLCGLVFSTADTRLDLTNAPSFSPDALMSALPYLPRAAEIALGSLPMSDAQRAALAAAYPDLCFDWRFLLYGLEVDSATESLALSGRQDIDPAYLSAQLACLPKLTLVELCGSNLANAEMEQLVAAHPAVKFVWTVRVGQWELRTDITAFSTGNVKTFEGGRFLGGRAYLTNDDVEPLKYCVDLVALDLGHNRRITDVWFVEHMPKLHFLVLGMMRLTDITPLAGLTELEFLETFQNYITDISPLLNLKKLTNLNCSTNMFTDISVLSQMTQLERLWLIHSRLSQADIAKLRELLPDCQICTSGDHSASNGWRTDNQLYLEMQKLFNLPAQDQGGRLNTD